MKRGFYLNNPACIRLSRGNNWKGLSKVQQDKEFCTFDSVFYGIRALIIILRRYFYTYRLTNVSSIISRYAPPSENNTTAYISFVRGFVENPDNLVLFDPWKKPTLQCFHLCQAICKMESGMILSLQDFVKSVTLL